MLAERNSPVPAMRFLPLNQLDDGRKIPLELMSFIIRVRERK